METYASPFAFLLLGWSCGFFSSLIFHYFAFQLSTKHIEDHLGS